MLAKFKKDFVGTKKIFSARLTKPLVLSCQMYSLNERQILHLPLYPFILLENALTPVIFW